MECSYTTNYTQCAIGAAFPGLSSCNVAYYKTRWWCWKSMCNTSMGSLFLNATVGQGFQEASAIIKKTVPDIIRVFSSSACEELEEALGALKPVIDAMGKSTFDSLLPVQEFQGKFASGGELLKECPKTSNYDLVKKFSNAKEIDNILEWISKFIKDTLLPNMAMIVIDLPCRLDKLCTDLNGLASKIDQHMEKHSELLGTLIENSGANVEQQEWRFCVPNMPNFLVGLDRMVMQLENHVLDRNVSVVGITGSSGMGKSTLVSVLCHRNRIKERFNKKVIYIAVSKSPNIMDILTDMWEQIVDDGRKPRFNNEEAAHMQLQSQISPGSNQPTLVVLDDVWSMSDLQKLLFKGEHYKTLVTTRHADIIRQVPGAYPFPLSVLQEEDALSLFCHYAFGEPDIPQTHDRDLVKQVQVECKGLPVALQVIGSSMRGREDSVFWKSAKNKLSRGDPISSYHTELYESLKTSIDVLEENAKYFLDLAAFPEGRTISANALLDIWVCVHGMDWDNAFVLLHEFADRNLLTFNKDRWSPRIADGAYGLYFSQHDVMRDLALYLVKQDNKINCSRLCMPEKRDGFPVQWPQVHASKAKIVSIHTGTMDEERWRKMEFPEEFPEAEALVLYFTAIRYCIPAFLGTMKKLKVLIINNYSAPRATLRGLNGFEELSQLKTLQLERLLVPPLYTHFNFLKSLEKLSLSLCEGLGDMSKLDEDKFFNFPGLLEFNVDHCSDLEELPRGICSSKSLKMLSVTNCHQLAKLPDELGKIGLLQVLCLRACAQLSVLPHSIHSLQQLEILDISQCGSLKGFPDKFHELPKLKKLDMRECCKLKKFCKTLGKLTSLNRVICDKNKEQELIALRKANLTVAGFEVPFSLDWLYH